MIRKSAIGVLGAHLCTAGKSVTCRYRLCRRARRSAHIADFSRKADARKATSAFTSTTSFHHKNLRVRRVWRHSSMACGGEVKKSGVCCSCLCRAGPACKFEWLGWPGRWYQPAEQAGPAGPIRPAGPARPVKPVWPARDRLGGPSLLPTVGQTRFAGVPRHGLMVVGMC